MVEAVGCRGAEGPGSWFLGVPEPSLPVCLNREGIQQKTQLRQAPNSSMIARALQHVFLFHPTA